jgi:EAL and modified HD-GYP domain-containing signal transduction protein
MNDPKAQSAASVPAADHPTRFLGRQPILDARGHVFGHELLFRSTQSNAFSGDQEHATRDVIDHCLMLLPGTDKEASFVNCTRNALVSGIVTLLPPASTVLEILEDIDPDPELLEACRDLKKKGYRFALDDFEAAESKLPLLDIADFIKIDFLASDPAARSRIYAMASKSHFRFLAEKVETEADVQVARSEGCDLFQGYFFAKPAIVETRVIPQNHAIYLQLLAALTRTPSNVSEIERLVIADASLCYRLLRLVNSARYALRTPIASIRSALVFVGDDEFRKMVTVALAGLAANTRSKALVQMALERARTCELLAPSMHTSASRLYLLGMLSVIDVILAMPMSQIVSALPLDREMKAALLGQKSSLSPALDFARCRESGDWQRQEEIQHALGISCDTAWTIHVYALQWADATSCALQA